MLTHLYIRDFAIIEQLELELHPGLTALTGETGAGKSILLEAIGLVLGDKADSSTVRHGTQKAEVTLSIDTSHIPGAQHWLNSQELEQDEQCILRRVVNANGKSRAWINGSPVTLALLRELGEQLVDIHGQHEHQLLMKKEMQRHLLDAFADNNKLLKKTKEFWKHWRTYKQQLDTLLQNQQQHQERKTLLQFQTEELATLDLGKDEIRELDEELSRLANAEQLKQTTAQAQHRLYEEEPSLYSLLGQVNQDMESLKSYDERLGEPLELLAQAQIQVQEAAWFLRDYTEQLDLDPERLQWVERRIADIRDMARKYRVEPEQIPELLEQLQQELETLSSDHYDLDALQQNLQHSAEAYQKAAQSLSKQRQKAAKKLSQSVTQAMQQLGMQGGQFLIAVTPEHANTFQPEGTDHIEFTVSANPGQPLKPLTKVASGGELSRITLAIHMIASSKISAQSLIFDEVDSGVGGSIAEMIGQQLQQLGQNRQVLCITHLPQVAAQAHQHLQVSKQKSRKHTQTQLHYLSDAERTEEIARMIGGIDITQATRTLAEEMLGQKVSVN